MTPRKPSLSFADKRIWIVRHGQSEGNADRELYRQKADPIISLTDTGHEQAHDLGARFFYDVIQRYTDGKSLFEAELLVSPYLRAKQTAEGLLQGLRSVGVDTRGIVYREESALHEMRGGLLERMTMKQLKAHDLEEYTRAYNYFTQGCWFWYQPPGGESCEQVGMRLESLIRAIQESRARDIIIVAHGQLNRALARMLLKETWAWQETQKIPPNCSVRVIADGQDYGYQFFRGTLHHEGVPYTGPLDKTFLFGDDDPADEAP